MRYFSQFLYLINRTSYDKVQRAQIEQRTPLTNDGMPFIARILKRRINLGKQIDNIMIKYQDSSSEEEDIQQHPAIQRCQIVDSKISIDHLICPICHHVVWQPVSCGSSQGCHSSFCKQCIQSWLKRFSNNQSNSQNNVGSNNPEDNRSNRSLVNGTLSTCPTCKKTNFICSIIPPIMTAILSSIVLKCKNHSLGCQEIINYKDAAKHAVSCQCKLKKCSGCKKSVLLKEYQKHISLCQDLTVICQKCGTKMMQGQYPKHAQFQATCLGLQVSSFGSRVNHLSHKLSSLESSTYNLEELTSCLFSAEPLKLQIQLYTPFMEYFVFPNPTLIRPSYNPTKQKNDFLHFYSVHPIFTLSMASLHWSVKVSKMNGSILIGFCSSMNVSSLDFIINKHGELKRKDLKESKYRIVKKAQSFGFATGDILKFKYSSLKRVIRIINENRRAQMELGNKEIQEMGQTIYTFYSIETLHDSLTFL